MGISIQVTYDGNAVPASVLHDPNLQVDTETALNNIMLAQTGITDYLIPVTVIDGMPARYDASDAAHKAGTIRRQQFGMGLHTTEDYYSEQTGADADALRFEFPYGFYSPSATVFLLCFDKNLDAGIINDVVYPINCEDIIITPPMHSGDGIPSYNYMRRVSIDIQSTSGGSCIIDEYGLVTSTRDLGNDVGSTTLKFIIKNVGKRINRIIMLRLSKFEVYRSSSRATVPFVCPKISEDGMTYRGIHLLNLPSWFGIDSNNNLYIGQKKSSITDNYMDSLYCISDNINYNVIAYFSGYFKALYSEVSDVRVNCAGVHNNLLLLTYTCAGYSHDPYYGTARGNKTYYSTNFPDNVPIYSLNKSNNEFKRWGYADFSIIHDTYNRIMISGIGDRINGNENNVLTFALFGYNSSSTPSYNYFYVVNGNTELQTDGTYIFTATSYEKIQLDIGGYTSVPDHCCCIYQANGKTFFKQSSSYLDNSNYRTTQKKDFGTYILNDIPTDNTVEITNNIETVNFDCITESGNSSSTSAVRKHKCLMPVSGIGGINKRAFITDTSTESGSYYKIVEPTYNVTPVVCDIYLQDGGIDIGANENIEFTMVVDANDELTYEGD